MRIVQTFVLLFIVLISISNSNVYAQISVQTTKYIIDSLSSDILRGRLAGSEGEHIATDFISNEFKKLGLTPAGDNGTYFQVLTKYSKVVEKNALSLNKLPISEGDFFVDTNVESIYSKKLKDIAVKEIPEGTSFQEFRKQLISSDQLTFVWVKSKEHLISLSQLIASEVRKPYQESIASPQRIIWVKDNPTIRAKFKKIVIDFSQDVEKVEMRNVMAKLKGATEQTVMISAHHDHLGILKTIQGDSIANGADDNASGVSAVIQIASYFAKRKNINKRTLLFTTFTAEELGLVGSTYMASKMTEEELKNIVAMVNIEMIGKTSANGKRKAYITGYNKSSLGKIMSGNVLANRKVKFKFFADPYEDLNLFMRSDNAPFAAKGVPAHTVSSTDIDFDSFYHTVNDEPSTINYNNVVEVTKGIIVGIEPIVKGRETPNRIR
ncbi:M28 family peptidase [Flammeovirga pectinis]|uniref:M28 family peptidase n=1 Tax=Flammeovirga pectinis TaxID=2494373 RepID=A0A3S9P4A9_9BACT|nr:M28 family peptidase [Flammeovirga pectinis]AZQ63045.1 M28 family peptidase [Flammeovirga pectinis]